MNPGNDKKIPERIHRFVIAVLVFFVLFIYWGGFSVRAEDINSLNPLYQTLPAKQFREYSNWEKIKTPELPFSRTKGVFEALSEDGRLQGTVIHMSSPGYGGPIDLMVAFDPLGRIVKVNVFRHQETDCHITGMTKGNFLEQFIGLTLWDKLRMLVGLNPAGRGDVQAMTGGTVTSKAVTEAVAESRKVYFKLYFENLTK